MPDAAKHALAVVIPLLEKHALRWWITGGFACYVYGVERPITDIDIDIDISKDSEEFAAFLQDLQPYVTQPLLHFVDQYYDNFNVEAEIAGQVVDICPADELNIYDRERVCFRPLYENGKDTEVVEWEGFRLPLLTKDLIIRNKEMISGRSEFDSRDIEGLKGR